MAAQRAPEASASLDAAADLDPSGDTHGGLDVGAMAVARRGADWGDGSQRHRAGVRQRGRGVHAAPAGPGWVVRSVRARAASIGGATVAVDADVTTTPTVFGDERRVAVGGEVWTVARTFGVRGGVSVNTIGDRRTALSGGLSAALKKGMYVDGQLTGGTDEGRRGWGVGLRVTF